MMDIYVVNADGSNLVSSPPIRLRTSTHRGRRMAERLSSLAVVMAGQEFSR